MQESVSFLIYNIYFFKCVFFLEAEDILEVDKNESAPKEKDVPTKEKCEDEKPKEKKWVKADSDDEGKKESSLFRCIPKKKKVRPAPILIWEIEKPKKILGLNFFSEKKIKS